MSGIPIKKYIDIENTTDVLVVKSNVSYAPQDLPLYKEQFNELVEDGTISQGSFEDNEWIVLGLYSFHNMRFDFGTKPIINDALKAYIVVKYIGRDTSSSNAAKSLMAVKKILLATNFFNKNNLADYRESITYFSDFEKTQLYYAKEFIRFYNFNAASEYLNVLKNVSIPLSTPRRLPSYRSLLLFDNILTNFFDSASETELERFYPILLWWKISKIIPIRPIEFCILPWDCCYYLPEDNSYYLKIERRKLRNGVVKSKKIPKINTMKITHELYQLIKRYRDMVDPQGNSKYLLPYQAYSKHLKCSVQQKSLNRKIDKDLLSPPLLRYLLKKFYIEIIEGVYKFNTIEKSSKETLADNDIEFINLGDTRHVAFCSMMLQGLNPLTIAQLGGHETLREQQFYHSHMDTFVDAHTYVLARAIKGKLNNRQINLDISEKTRKQTLERLALRDNFYSLRKTKYGRCKSKNFPYECTEAFDHCFFCNHFIGDENIPPDILKELSVKIEKEIQTKIEFIKTISSRMMIDANSSEYDLQVQEKLQTESKSLQSYIQQQAVINAYQLKKNEV